MMNRRNSLLTSLAQLHPHDISDIGGGSVIVRLPSTMLEMCAFPSFWEHATHIVLCLTLVPLWQTDSWLPTLHSVAPREQPSSSAGRSGPPKHKQGETHNKYATESKVQRDQCICFREGCSHAGLFAPVF